jgi:putative ABC transport system ATP-binding protein
MAMLGRLNRELGKTLVMVTHDPKTAAAAGRVLHLEKGRLVETVVNERAAAAAEGGIAHALA